MIAHDKKILEYSRPLPDGISTDSSMNGEYT